jgi:Transmembrane domain of unknown function (DUF3566)
MPPDEPGAPSPGPRDTGSTATFGAGVEAVDAPEARDGAPDAPASAPAEPDQPKKVPPRHRFLDDPDPEVPKAPKPQKVRARKVHRIVRHVDPWSVLKISVLFFLSIFLIICVASAVLWNAARSAGAIDDVESFITSLGFGNCEDIEGGAGTTPTTTTTPIDGSQPQVVGGASTTVPAAVDPAEQRSTIPDEDGKCAEGQRLVGGFKFEDARIFESFALGGVVLVLSGAAFSVVMALLFNLISDLTGGVRVTVLEEEPAPRRTGSPTPTSRD